MRLLAVLALTAGVGGTSLSGQNLPTSLAFQGLRPAMSRAAADSVVAQHGAVLRCQPTREPRLQACSAQARIAGDLVTVTLSLVDDRVGIALISGRLPAERIADWYASLTAQYGEVTPARRAGQESFQWIEARQMLRLTVRREAGGLTASISLVDGALLDGLPSP